MQMFDAIDGTFMPFSCDARIVFIAMQEGLRKFDTKFPGLLETLEIFENRCFFPKTKR